MLHPEKIEHHIKHLEEKLEGLKKQVDTMERTGVYDSQDLQNLKKEKLHLKDEIERFKQLIKKP